jgi:Acyl-CoA dehydrogenase, C-terminal domain
LLTPLLKASATDQGFHGASECLQVFGGHGYVSEWGIEQIVRDARIAMIYEGTNEIQAIDLLIRKTLSDGGTQLAALVQRFAQSLQSGKPEHADLLGRMAALQSLTSELAAAQAASPTVAYWVAGDYLRLFTLVALQWAWAQIDQSGALGQGGAPANAALHNWVLPEWDMRVRVIEQQLKQVG